MEPHAETSQNRTSFLVIRRKKEQIIKDENEVQSFVVILYIHNNYL